MEVGKFKLSRNNNYFSNFISSEDSVDCKQRYINSYKEISTVSFVV